MSEINIFKTFSKEDHMESLLVNSVKYLHHDSQNFNFRTSESEVVVVTSHRTPSCYAVSRADHSPSRMNQKATPDVRFYVHT